MQPITPTTSYRSNQTTAPARKTASSSVDFAQALEQASKPVPKLKLSELPCTLEQMHAARAQALDSFRRKFEAFVLSAGIDTSKPIALQLAPDGHVCVPENHPDKEKIAAFFRENPEAERSCHDALCFQEQIKSMEESPAFQEAYRRDPERSVARFSHLFDRTTETFFSLVVGRHEDQLTYDFEQGTRHKT